MKFDKNIYLENYVDMTQFEDEADKVQEYSHIVQVDSSTPVRTISINMEVWRTADHQEAFPETVVEANSLTETDIARYGLFIPKNLKTSSEFSYKNFIATDGSYKRTEMLFRLGDELEFLNDLREKDANYPEKNIYNGLYIPNHCVSDSEPCATVLTSHYYDTKFFVQHVELFKLKMKVYFLGDNLKFSARKLVDIIKNSNLTSRKRTEKLFLVLHWTPSEIIDGSEQYDVLAMPKCELYKNFNTSCKYEANSIAIYYNEHIAKKSEDLKNILR